MKNIINNKGERIDNKIIQPIIKFRCGGSSSSCCGTKWESDEYIPHFYYGKINGLMDNCPICGCYGVMEDGEEIKIPLIQNNI